MNNPKIITIDGVEFILHNGKTYTKAGMRCYPLGGVIDGPHVIKGSDIVKIQVYTPETNRRVL